jgi:uncharacterized protein YegL
MSNGYTDITVVIDKSSSMGQHVRPTIDGFNKFLTEQRKIEGEAKLSVIQFNDRVEVDCEAIALGDVEELSERTYTPSGMTAMNDAIATAILRAKARFGRLSEEDRPEKTIFVIITDGDENSSKEFPGNEGLNRVKAMIEQQQTDGWKFIFLASNLNAVQLADGYGIRKGHAMNYAASARGVEHAYVATSNLVGGSRSRAYDGAAAASLCFSDADAEAANEILAVDTPDAVRNDTSSTSSSSGS